jgi:hypothetical protein
VKFSLIGYDTNILGLNGWTGRLQTNSHGAQRHGCWIGTDLTMMVSGLEMELKT